MSTPVIFGKRFMISIICLLILHFFIFIENPEPGIFIKGILGDLEFHSFFDRGKFFLPIVLLLLISSDYLSNSIGSKAWIFITRYNNRHEFFLILLKRLCILVFKYWIVLVISGIISSLFLGARVVNFLNLNFFLLCIIGYIFYNMIISIQLLLSVYLDVTVSFLILLSIVIISTFVTSNHVKYLLLLPIGMRLTNIDVFMLIRITIVITITMLATLIIYKKIERLDL